ncbi:MAG TPA: DUF779 domain-containing protein [Acidimicrobiales bacterium]|nr:DUF779 domain-containing protein [Acidimicrobiales bacterium]
MRVESTSAADAVVRRTQAARSGELTITIGTGCCDSTAPFLYEDFWPGPDQEVVGEVAGVPVYAPEYLRSLYPGDDAVVVDVFVGPAESLSIETEWGCRLILRGMGVDAGQGPDDACAVPFPDPPAEPRTVVGSLPPHLAKLRIR